MKYFLLALVLLLASCEEKKALELEVRPSSNTNLTVEVLSDVDGCRIYRFDDYGYHYFVRCGGPVTTAMDIKSCGKNCRKEESIETVQR